MQLQKACRFKPFSLEQDHKTNHPIFIYPEVAISCCHLCESLLFVADVSESDESDSDEADTKLKKLKSLGSSMVQSASVLAWTLMACEEK